MRSKRCAVQKQGITFKFRTEKHYLVKHFAVLKNVCIQYLNFMLRVTYCFFFLFYELLIGP